MAERHNMREGEAEPIIFLEQSNLPEVCFLQEVLHWGAFQRLPPDWYEDGQPIRETGTDQYKTTVPFGDDGLFDHECERVGLPKDPRTSIEWSGGVFVNDDLESILTKARQAVETLNDATQPENRVLEEATRLHQALGDWRPKYERAIEFAAAKTYCALREGVLTSKGVLLPDPDPATALKKLADDGKGLEDLEFVAIPPETWSSTGIYWGISAARHGDKHYCQIYCPTKEALALFPYDKMIKGERIEGVIRYGSFFVVDNSTLKAKRKEPTTTARRRGRLAQYDWVAMHLDLAEVLRDGGLPDKKEAAIASIQGKFAERGLKAPSRTEIGNRLTPYYERFGNGKRRTENRG
jgi:hypothetical protein